MSDLSDFLPSNIKSANRSVKAQLRRLERAKRRQAGKQQVLKTEVVGDREYLYRPTKGWLSRRA